MTDDDGSLKDLLSDELAEVIPLPSAFQHGRNALEAKLDELPVRAAERDYAKGTPCKHRRATVDPQNRVVTCRGCGATLDPITVLEEFARRWESLTRQGSMLASQVASLRQTLSDLERAEKNAKSRLRSARKRLQATLDPAAVEAACAATYDSRRVLGYTDTWEQLPEVRRASYRSQIFPALEAFAAYEAPEAEPGVETA